MSTRANVILKQGNEELFFYRHSDGYPEGTLPTLNRFIEWMKEGKIRNNLLQGGGWLIMIGALEYNTIPEYSTCKVEGFGGKLREEVAEYKAPENWKVASYEPTTGLHGDVEYIYAINMDAMTITVVNV